MSDNNPQHDITLDTANSLTSVQAIDSVDEQEVNYRVESFADYGNFESYDENTYGRQDMTSSPGELPCSFLISNCNSLIKLESDCLVFSSCLFFFFLIFVQCLLFYRRFSRCQDYFSNKQDIRRESTMHGLWENKFSETKYKKSH